MLDKNNNTVITGQAPLLALSYVCAWRSFMARALNHQPVGSPNSSGAPRLSAYGKLVKNWLLLGGGVTFWYVNHHALAFIDHLPCRHWLSSKCNVACLITGMKARQSRSLENFVSCRAVSTDD